jgi:thiamine pyrophosphokinase
MQLGDLLKSPPPTGRRIFLRAVIIANGILDNHDRVLSQLKPEDLLIAADGGTEHCKKIGIRPDIVIGDMDSISTQLMAEFQSNGTKFIIHSRDKDQTDLELALSYAQQNGVNEVIFFGIFGGRLDLSLSNILLLTRDEWKPISLVVINGPDTACLLRAKGSISVKGKPGDLVSLVPLSEVVEGVSTRGLRWQLDQAVLLQGNTRSVSNELLIDSAQVRIDKGKLLLVHRDIPIEGTDE